MPLKERSISWLLSLLKNVGSPAVLPWAFRQIRQLFDGEPDRYRDFLINQAHASGWLPRFFAGHELHTVYEHDTETVLHLLRELSGAEKEIVREGAARSWSKLLERDYDPIFSLIRDLRNSDQYEKRYTAALAPVRFYDEQANDDRKRSIRSFWESYENDSRKGLANLVRQQILERRKNS